MKVIFMGTPSFAVPALKALIASQHDVIAVYTNAAKNVGRGHKLSVTAVHQVAQENSIPVYTPAKLTTPEAVEEFAALGADVACVAAYGKLLRPNILQSPKFGCLNIHPSLLPRWRGAAPLQRTIMAGDEQTAVCIMQMDAGLDTGDILMQQALDVPLCMTASQLHDVTAQLGAELLVKTLDRLQAGDAIAPIKQVGEPTYAEKLCPEDELIDWYKDAKQVQCLIRALSPKPAAYFMYKKQKIKIIAAEYDLEANSAHAPGTVVDDKLSIQCAKGLLKPTLVQREGKKMIYTDAFLRGFPIEAGIILGSLADINEKD